MILTIKNMVYSVTTIFIMIVLGAFLPTIFQVVSMGINSSNTYGFNNVVSLLFVIPLVIVVYFLYIQIKEL